MKTMVLRLHFKMIKEIKLEIYILDINKRILERSLKKP